MDHDKVEVLKSISVSEESHEESINQAKQSNRWVGLWVALVARGEG